MSTHAHTLLTGVALLLGGLVAAGSHLLEAMTTVAPDRIADYVAFTQSVHLALFVGGVLILFGWSGFYGLESACTGLPTLLTFLSVFLGILLGDLLHCVLEFSILPVLISLAPYVVPEMKQAAYGLTPFAALVRTGRSLLLIGTPGAAAAIWRSRSLSVWAAFPFVFSAILFAIGTLAFTEHQREYVLAAFYMSTAVLGIFVIAKARTQTLSMAYVK
jgi:hypothetical protein